MSEAQAQFASALAALQAGRLAEAESTLRAIAAREPGFVPALQLLGTALSSAGRAQESLEWFERAAGLAPPTAALLHNRAQALLQLGRAAEARADLERAVAIDPALHPAWNLLGNARAALGEGALAQSAYDRALELRPDHVATHFNRALFMHGAGRLDEAIAGYREALRLHPSLDAARAKLADALNEAGMEDLRAKRLDRAAARFREALAANPALEEALNNLGAAYAAMSRLDDALDCFRQAVARSPGNADALSNLGFILHARGDEDAAAAHFERALAIRPDHADALTNLGLLRQERGERAAARELYERALAVNPASAIAGYNLGILRLCDFDFESGWELNELRYETVPPMATRRHLSIPEFTAADWGAKVRVGVWGEQGVGDRLVYSTLLPELEERGVEFILETDARLVAAYRRAHPRWNVVTREESAAAFATCDRQIALAGLPRLMRRSLADFARQPRVLLAADPRRVAGYRERLGPGRVAGISWRSSQSAARASLQRRKSATLDAFLELSKRSDLRLLDLQYGDTAAERAGFASRGGKLERFEDLDLFNDLDGVMAAIESCDLVITTSNVTAHLAGALGKRTLLVYLRAEPPFHYWATDASGRCLWYPAITIVTGRDVATWEGVLAGASALA
ncbi:MAG: tetratricopeptide repeat protein [Usitatibacter sp.]